MADGRWKSEGAASTSIDADVHVPTSARNSNSEEDGFVTLHARVSHVHLRVEITIGEKNEWIVQTFVLFG